MRGAELSASESTAGAIAGRVMMHAVFLLIAAGAFVAYQHFSLHHQSGPALASLVAAAGFGLAPLRALVGELFAIERQVMHLAHGLAGLGFLGLVLGGKISGGPILTHAALAPFAIMGAAQAIMHQDHPRTPEQAAALRRFATSLPEVEQFTKSGNLTSPANARRAVAVLTDLVSKAQTLGETELRSDPGFQSALRRVTMRSGLSLSLDMVDRALTSLSENPTTAGAVPELRKRLAVARRTIEAH